MAALVNNKPDLTFSYLGGNLVVTDILEEYDDINVKNYICLEYLTYNDDSTKLRNVTIRENLETLNDIQTSIFTLSSDGTHAYHRFMIPRVRKYANSGMIKPFNLFYYKHEFYYALEQVAWGDINLSDETKFVKVAISDIYQTLEDGLALKGENEVMYSKYIVFSYELLKKAFVQAQDYLTKTYTIKDTISFDWNKDGREERDLLLAVLHATREYVRRRNYSDAQLLVSSLMENNCLGFNSNVNNETEFKCGCSSKKSNVDIEFKQEITTDDLVFIKTNWIFGDAFPIQLS